MLEIAASQASEQAFTKETINSLFKNPHRQISQSLFSGRKVEGAPGSRSRSSRRYVDKFFQESVTFFPAGM